MRNALRFGVAIAAIMIAGLMMQNSRSTIFTDRSFFGIYRVTLNAGPSHILFHGSTIHGAQLLKEPTTPLTYYHANGPVGGVFQKLQLSEVGRHVGIVGLGTGSILCYGRPGESWTFFEIDPKVETIARNPELFSFLSECTVKPRVVLGDARLTLAREPAGSFSVLVLDAFSSDAIPVHLLTREALAVYMRALKDDGILMVHISNRRLDLEPVVSAIVKDAGIQAVLRDHDVDENKGNATYEYGSEWVVIAKRREVFAPLLEDTRWRSLVPADAQSLWTDDYSNLFSVIKW